MELTKVVITDRLVFKFAPFMREVPRRDEGFARFTGSATSFKSCYLTSYRTFLVTSLSFSIKNLCPVLILVFEGGSVECHSFTS